jgi:DNA-directed RNA polymerase subunit M/transcription elongation factor TFIIS
MTNDKCPKCGSDSFDTLRHSWREGVTPYPDVYICCSCEHEWTMQDLEDEDESKS